MNENFSLFLKCIINAKDDDEFKQLLMDNFETEEMLLCLSILMADNELSKVSFISLIRGINKVFNEVNQK